MGEIKKSELNFEDLEPRQEEVPIDGKKYLLKEASGDAACKWRNALLKATKLSPDGKVATMDGMADTEPLLVSMCLFEMGDNGGLKVVSLNKVRNWPHRVQRALFERAKEISELHEAGDSIEALEKQVEVLQERISKLKAEKAADEAEESDPTTDGFI